MLPQFTSTYTELAKTSEASEVLYAWAALSGTAAALGRNIGLPFGSGSIYPNLYINFVGDPGTRKSSAIKQCNSLLGKSGYDSFCGDKVTLQKLLCDLAGVDESGEVPDKPSKDFSLDKVTLEGLGYKGPQALPDYSEMFICQDEFSDFIGQNNFPMIAWLGNAWDIAKAYEYRIRTGASLWIPTPTINILGGTTPGQFVNIFPTSVADQGFLSRMILVSAAATNKKFHHPAPPDARAVAAVIEHWKRIRATVKGIVKVTPEADELLKAIYHDWKPLEDGRFAFYSTRRHTQLLKLCMIAAADRYSLAITPTDVIFANTLLLYTERHMPDALGAFGKEDNSDVSNRIVDLINRSNKPLSPHEIYPTIQRDILYPDFMKLIASLTQGSMVQLANGKFLPKKSPIQRPTDKHVDWGILKGIAPDLLF